MVGSTSIPSINDAKLSKSLTGAEFLARDNGGGRLWVRGINSRTTYAENVVAKILEHGTDELSPNYFGSGGLTTSSHYHPSQIGESSASGG